jgi:hypothetical protein
MPDSLAIRTMNSTSDLHFWATDTVDSWPAVNNALHDEVGFDESRLLAGEASAREGRVRPAADVIDELRRRLGE